MNPNLTQIVSIINGYVNAKDSERVFTYIEFVKMFGYENDTNTFISQYKNYVTAWANIKKTSINVSDDDFIMSRMIDILKSITLDYSNYEEQDFIAHLDLSNKNHLKALSALFSRKIRQITQFYRKKRNESVTVIRRNSMKGSTKSIEEIIYEKVFDFVFSNRNILPSYKNIKRDLLVSVENYVDTYSQYFDIPRQKQFTDKTRAQMLSANMNDVDYRVYLEIQLVVSQILFSGNVYLEEIPLVAQVGVDLSQSCVGDMLALKNNLMANTQVNQVDLNEQVALKRKLYEKFLGCDLWWLYVDLQGNITMDVLCKAKNPTGNLLNCGSADTATIQNEDLTLLSQIGLFFKPDKTSILKVNAKDYTWTVDLDVIQNDTMYVFPDPSRYGDIGNNKQSTYPLLMQYKLDYDIRNLSSGLAANDPMMYITDQGWYSYYSKQDDDFKIIDNKDYEYVFTWLANKGYITNYQQDIWGNHFGLLKGLQIVYKTDDEGNHILDENGNKIIDKIIVQENQIPTTITGQGREISGEALLLNGGYFEDPFYQGEEKQVITMNYDELATSIGLKDIRYHYKDKIEKVPFQVSKVNNVYYRQLKPTGANQALYQSNIRYDVSGAEIKLAGDNWEDYYEPYQKKTVVWRRKDDFGEENTTVPFDFDKYLVLTDTYRWTGIKINNNAGFYHSGNTNFINFGSFERNLRYPAETTYQDNFRNTNIIYQDIVNSDDDIISDVILDFYTKDVYKDNEITIQKVSSSYQQIKNKSGNLFIKTLHDLSERPKLIKDVFNWLNWDDIGDVIDYYIVKNTIIFETKDLFVFVPYTYDGVQITSTLGLKELYKIRKTNADYTKLLFVEDKKKVYILQTSILESSNKSYVIPTIYVFDPIQYTMKDCVDILNHVYKKQFDAEISKMIVFDSYVQEKINHAKKEQYAKVKNLLDSSISMEFDKFRDFEVPFLTTKEMIKNVVFSYNSTLGLYLLSFILNDKNGTPYLFEYKFKIDSLQYFEGSLLSAVYTIKKVVNNNNQIVGINYCYNNSLINPSKTSMYPIRDDKPKEIFIKVQN